MQQDGIVHGQQRAWARRDAGRQLGAPVWDPALRRSFPSLPDAPWATLLLSVVKESGSYSGGHKCRDGRSRITSCRWETKAQTTSHRASCGKARADLYSTKSQHLSSETGEGPRTPALGCVFSLEWGWGTQSRTSWPQLICRQVRVPRVSRSGGAISVALVINSNTQQTVGSIYLC